MPQAAPRDNSIERGLTQRLGAAGDAAGAGRRPEAGERHIANGAGIGEHLQLPSSAVPSMLPWHDESAPDSKSANLLFSCPAR